MGSIDDDEPPSKRVRASSAKLGSISKTCSSLSESVEISGALMERPSTSNDNDGLIGSKGVIKKVELVRIIADALYSLGYERSGAVLEEESGIHLHSSTVNLFRKQVLDGDWDESVDTLHKIGLLDENILKTVAFLILEQKFVELLEKNKVVDALNTLRDEIAPLDINKKRVHELCGCIVSPSQCLLLGFANLGIGTVNSRIKFLEKLQKLFPPTVMIPERRLEHLVEQALNVQRRACYFHNSQDSSLSLYSDHQCGKEQIPSRTTQVLEGHKDEVWFIQFSYSGTHLASSSNDKSVIIWEVHEDGAVILKHTLIGHEKPVLMIAWSPDNLQLLTCGLEETVKRWDIETGKCLKTYEKGGVGLISCGWFPEGKQIFTGASDKSIIMWDLDGKEAECWRGQRSTKMSDMAVTRDGRRVISMCKESAILLLDREAKLEKLIEEDQTITSFSLSGDDKFLLVNLSSQELHLWSIEEDRPNLVMKYKGQRRSRFVIRSCFGGYEQSFVASGSEDSQVYIWHRSSGDLIGVLPGHSGAVNCVSWNPVDPHMLASASDDHTIRIWGVEKSGTKRVSTGSETAHSNGILHPCNGNGKYTDK